MVNLMIDVSNMSRLILIGKLIGVRVKKKKFELQRESMKVNFIYVGSSGPIWMRPANMSTSIFKSNVNFK